MTPWRAGEILSVTEVLRHIPHMVDRNYFYERHEAARAQELPLLDCLGYPVTMREIDEALDVLLNAAPPANEPREET